MVTIAYLEPDILEALNERGVITVLTTENNFPSHGLIVRAEQIVWC